MKSIYFARHAKSSWEYAGLSDAERPLLKKGIKRTEKVIKYLLENNMHPDLIISSHAVRAKETARKLADGLGYATESIKIDKRLYFYGQDDIFDIIFELPEDTSSVMLVSHNPEITNMANYFLYDKIDYMPTSGLVGFSFDTDDWTEIASAKRKVEIIAFPKLL